MGRPRKHNRHLPPRLYCRRGVFYYVVRGRWTALGRDIGEALRRWAEYEQAAHKPGQTVSEAIGYYIAARPDLSTKTLIGYHSSAKRLRAVFGHMALADLRPQDVTRYLRHSKARVAANRDKALLSAAYNYVSEEGWLDPPYNPAKVRRNTEKPRKRYVSDAELSALLDAATPKLRAMIELSYLTGMSKDSLLSLRLSDAQDDGLHVSRGKTGLRQVIEWTDELRRVVADARAVRRRVGSLWLFPSERRPDRAMTARGLHSEWDKVRRAAGLADVTWHDLRRKTGSDADEGHATALLGHSDPKVTRRHYRAKPARVKPLR